MFIVKIIEKEGAMKSRVSQALKISRQTIDNYPAIKKYFGTEGLVIRKLTSIVAQTPTGKWLTVEVGRSPLT